MYETLKSICDAINNDTAIVTKGGVAALSLDDVLGRQIGCEAADFPIRLYHLGISQTASAGALSLNGYFAITVTLKATERLQQRGADFVAVGERIVALLHRSRHNGQSVVFSKNIVANSSFILENSNRRISITVEPDNIVQVLFFWSTPVTLTELDKALAASTTTTSSATKSLSYASNKTSSSSSSTTTETVDTAAVDALNVSTELFP